MILLYYRPSQHETPNRPRSGSKKWHSTGFPCSTSSANIVSDNYLWDSSLPAQPSPGVSPPCHHVPEHLNAQNKLWPIARHGYSPVVFVARCEVEPVS